MSALLTPIAAFFRSSWRWLAIAAACAILGYLKGCSDGRAHMEAQYAADALKRAEIARKADAAASDQRAADTETIRKNEDARNDAIQSAPSGAPDAANRQLGCERLRQAGIDAAAAGC